MITLLVALLSFFGFIVAYHTYGRWLSRKLFNLDPAATVPSVDLRDDVDYCPTRREVIFGHHFTSIAGTGPIVGPAIAVFWGWLPALLWVVFGSIFIGAVHDFGALVVSLRNRGQTIGDVAGRIIGPRARLLFLVVLLFCLTVVLGIFGLVIAIVFAVYPESVISVWLEIPLALAIGFWVYKKRGGLLLPSLAALGVMYAGIWLGTLYPMTLGLPLLGANTGFANQIVVWTLILFVYCAVASCLPVWSLMQPRDFINSHELKLALVLLVLGLVVAGFAGDAQLVASTPAVAPAPADAPPLWPFLFIFIACGAVSGFHSLVSSGTTSKQLQTEPDAQLVGYGSMLLEGTLAVLVIIACCAGSGMGSYLRASPAILAAGARLNPAAGKRVDSAAVFGGDGGDSGLRLREITLDARGYPLIDPPPADAEALAAYADVARADAGRTVYIFGRDGDRPGRGYIVAGPQPLTPTATHFNLVRPTAAAAPAPAAGRLQVRPYQYLQRIGLGDDGFPATAGELNEADTGRIPVIVGRTRTYDPDRGEVVETAGAGYINIGPRPLRQDETGYRLVLRRGAWEARYGRSWQSFNKLPKKIGGFIEGGGAFLSKLGIPLKLAIGIMAVLVASFAATTLDTATRLERYVIQEIGRTVQVKPLTNKYAATAAAVALGLGVALIPGPAGHGSGGLIIWPVFGVTNQLLACLAFLVLLVYLRRRNKPTWFILAPAAFMLVVSTCGMIALIKGWLAADKLGLVVAGCLIEGVAFWLLIEGALVWKRVQGADARPADAAE